MSSCPHSSASARMLPCPLEEQVLQIRRREEIGDYMSRLMQIPPLPEVWPMPPVRKVHTNRMICTGPTVLTSEDRLDAACSCRQLLKSRLLDDSPLAPDY